MGSRYIVALLPLLILAGCRAKTPGGSPEAVFDETDFDFGRIPANSIVTHIYNLTNAGGDSIIIKKIRPNCGCTKAPLSDSTVRGGESVPIELRFDSRGYRGNARKSASVRLQIEAVEKREMLYFSSFIDTASVPFAFGDMGASPPRAEFTDSVEQVEITLANRTPVTRKIRVVEYQEDRIGLSWLKYKIEPRGEAKLTVKRKVPAKGLAASITLEMEGYRNSRITLPVSEYKTPPQRIGRASRGRRTRDDDIPWLK